MEMLLFAGVILLFVLVLDARRTISLLRTRIEQMEQALGRRSGDSAPTAEPAIAQPSATRPAPMPAEPRRAAKAQPKTPRESIPAPESASAKPAAPSPTPPKAPAPPPKPKVSAAKRFEDLIGGKLPIWIGGIALIFAGFFLVRFSIEAGLFGPLARCITAALFGLLLIGLSEFGNRIPKFGYIFADEPRIGHSIAGAGIAILYATLYMASELYGLIGPIGALVGVAAVTILAFALSQRHGPATALMGLLGGFAAPYVAGLGPESIAPLLIYLGVFTAGLFGLAIHRGWAWLALLATGGSVLWTTALLFMDLGSDAGFVGAFVTLLAIGSVLTLSRTGGSFGIPKTVLQIVPLGVGLLQLILLAPLISFSVTSWIFFAILSLFAIALAWKDEALVPAVAGALALNVAMIAAAFADGGANRLELIAAAGLILLYTAAGHIFSTRAKSGWQWAVVGLLAPTALLLIVYVFGDLDWSDNRWAIACAVVAITTAIMAWRTRAIGQALPLPLASGFTAILLAIALWIWLPESAAALVAIAIAAGLAYWATFTERRAVLAQSTVAILFGGLLMTIQAAGLIEALFASLVGETDLYRYLPEVAPMVLRLLLPALVIVAISFWFRGSFNRRPALAIAALGGAGTLGFVYLLVKQPLAIGPFQEFVSYGFVERGLFTHALALAGWLLLQRPWPEKWLRSLQVLGFACASLALFRFVYFDIFLLSPTAVKQAMGPAPIANLGTLHYGLAMVWLWLFARTSTIRETATRLVRPLEIASFFGAIITILITVRQAVHGTDIATPPFTSAETYLYSAGLMGLAIAWLARGIQTSSGLLRIAGLLLLTLVTFKVFLIDAAQLEGLLRILSFLGLGIALLGIGWVYGKIMRTEETATEGASETAE